MEDQALFPVGDGLDSDRATYSLDDAFHNEGVPRVHDAFHNEGVPLNTIKPPPPTTTKKGGSLISSKTILVLGVVASVLAVGAAVALTLLLTGNGAEGASVGDNGEFSSGNGEEELVRAFECPSSIESTTVRLEGVSSGDAIRLQAFGEGSCDLVLRDRTAGSSITVARSQNNGDWKSVDNVFNNEDPAGGFFASEGLTFSCSESSCITLLPDLSESQYLELASTAPPTPRATQAPTFAPTTPAAPTFSPTLPAAACAGPEEDPLALGPIEGKIRLEIEPDHLCILFRVGPGEDRGRTPVARSYENHPWEFYANEFALRAALQCPSGSSSCVLQLPSAFTQEGQSYELVALRKPGGSSSSASVARFLEQATFGPTRETLAAAASSELRPDRDLQQSSYYADWIADQVDRAPFSHREYYRSRLNARRTTTNQMALPTHPCEAGTRYRKYAFSGTDNPLELEVATDPVTQRKILLIDGMRRTVLNETALNLGRNNPMPDGIYDLCGKIREPKIGAKMKVRAPDGGCRFLYTQDNELIGIPRVYFDEDTGPLGQQVDLDGFAVVVEENFYPEDEPDQELLLERDLEDGSCFILPDVTGWPYVEVYGRFNGEWYLHDPRWDVYGNTIENPQPDGGAAVQEQVAAEAVDQIFYRTQCGNAEMNFLNQDGCYLSDESSVCTATFEDEGDLFVQAKVELNKQLLRQAKSRTEQVLLSVTGLRQNEGVPYDPPCTPSTRSRWIQVAGGAQTCNQGGANATTLNTFSKLLGKSTDSNPNVRDIFTPAVGAPCDATDLQKFDFMVLVEDQCWLNVHQDHLQIFDFSSWIPNHPGGRQALLQFAEKPSDDAPDPTFELLYPASHDMNRWHEAGKPYRKSIGRFGDTVQLRLPLNLVERVGGEIVGPSLGSSIARGIVCGSAGEVANDHTLPGTLQHGAFDAASNRDETTERDTLIAQKLQIWMHAALNAPDQLRQRIAWALSQLLVITPGSVAPGANYMTEAFLAYYDIFVRHAFGRYRDILREVTFSPLMGEMLSYVGSRSTAYVWETEKKVEYADENYAREVMQLFSIGLFKLNNDGTLDVDENGAEVYTYSNDEISEYARLFTGFAAQISRGNIEQAQPEFTANPIDPMRINLQVHDRFPKLGLNGDYIGDGLSLCRDSPDGQFLSKGAQYRLLGRSSSSAWLMEPVAWTGNDEITRLKVNESSALYSALCGSQDGSTCTFRGMVELSEDLECDGSLCDIQEPRVLEVGSGVFYEYTRPPCSRFAFFDDAKLMRKYQDAFYCEDKSLNDGAFSCCDGGNGAAENFNVFMGERVDFSEAEGRCQSNGLEICFELELDCLDTNTCDDSIGHWTNETCGVLVKINLEGQVAIVHSIPEAVGQQNVDLSVKEDTKSFFRVDWNDRINEFLSDYENNCESLGCQRDQSDNLCLCETMTVESQAFDTIPFVEDILQLKIGVDDSQINNVTAEIADGVILYFPSGILDSTTVFEVEDESGRRIRRKNIKSDVIIGKFGDEATEVLSFRNPTHLVSLSSPELREVYHEIEAALDHYFYHFNTAPFLAVRFAKRFGNSNPSPRYVNTMANAFRRGRYTDTVSGQEFGSGNYGDIGALMAALLLDREARSEILDVDPSSGAVHEPFLRLVRVMRSLDWEGNPDSPFPDFGLDLQPRIGQQPYEMPSVFSFFLPEYQPGGPISDASLTCPECQELTGPSSIALVNGLLSLVKYGLNTDYGGFGKNKEASGKLAYVPENPEDVAAVVEDLSILLTAGRLSQEKLTKLEAFYSGWLNEFSAPEALTNLQQLMVTAPEFHSNGLSDNSQGNRPLPEDPTPSQKPYKAVVFLLLQGGYDSFNLLVPQKCPGNDLVRQYDTERGEIGLTEEERTLIIDADEQPCSQFSIHPSFPLAKELYNSSDLAFFANAGLMTSADMTNADYKQKVPFQLFAHNHMQHEMQAMDGFNEIAGTGVMGRMSSVLSDLGFSTNTIAIDGTALATQSEFGSAPAPLLLSRFGPEKLSPRPSSEELDIEGLSASLNGQNDEYASLFGEAWSDTFISSVQLAEKFQDQLGTTELGDHWSEQSNSGDTYSDQNLIDRLQLLSKLIQTKDDRGVDRDFFFVPFGGWDHHRNLQTELKKKMEALNEALDKFVVELKAQDRFDDVTVVVTSEFGRTMTPNSGGGSDHAWGGNYFMFGGRVDGGRILGSFPEDITPESDLNLGRGRLLPTTSWDCIWNAVCQWVGIDDDDELDYILPNRQESSGSAGSIFSPLFTQKDLFKEGENILLRERKK